MDREKEDNIMNNHTINLNDRKSVSLTGVKKLNSFDDNEFFVDSLLGSIIIKGESLELLKLDTYHGNLSIKGKINSIMYLDDNKKSKADSIMTRLFK